MKIVFACGPGIGHLNPMLAMARSLVDLGHEVHFRSTEAVQQRIKGAGAQFHDAAATQPEFYFGRKLSGPLGAIEDVMKEHGLNPECFLPQLQVQNIALEQQLPGALRLLRELQPVAVVYDALMTARDMMFAARLLGIPAVGVWTLAGPGAWTTHSVSTMLPLTLADADDSVANFAPHAEATRRIQQRYGLDLCAGLPQPVGKVDTFDADAVLITTSEDLQDPISAELAEAYESDGTRFVYIGPLLTNEAVASMNSNAEDEVLDRVRSARAMSREVILVSMGTLLVSPHALNGWEGCSGGSSLTGCQLCRAAWAGAFDAFGSNTQEAGALIVVSVGYQPNPFGDVQVPPNAVCVPCVDQQRILEAGVDVFLTHGGQNSFMEAMSYATPVVVCPGFGDQVVNSRKAEALGVGMKVDRPYGESDSNCAVQIACKYRKDVSLALREVCTRQSFRAAAGRVADSLRSTGRVRGAVDILLSVADSGTPRAKCAPCNKYATKSSSSVECCNAAVAAGA